MSDLSKNRSLFNAAVTRTRKRRSELKSEVASSAILRPNDLQPELVVTMWDVAHLRAPKTNARTIDPAHVASVAAAMGTFTNLVPLLVSPDGSGAETAEIIDGVTRLAAAKLLGLTQLPCIAVDVPEAKRKALRLRVNREQELGGWVIADLGEILIELKDLQIDLSVTGFGSAEIDLAMTMGAEVLGKPEAEDLTPADGPTVTRPGDLVLMGPHRLICGDALVADTYDRLMRETKAQIVVSDPPYNQPAKRIGGRGRIQHADFAQAAGELSEDAFGDFCATFITLMRRHMVPGAYLYLFMDWMHVVTLIQAALKCALIQKNLIVWDKGHGGMGAMYRSAHELIPLFQVPGGTPKNNVQLGRFGRDRQNVFRYPGANTMGSSARAELKNHPTPKNVECIGDMLLDASDVGDVVLDSFVGSGTIFIAAERTHRIAYGIELSPAYCDLAIRRWQRETGKAATLEETGESFEAVAARRAVEPAGDETLIPDIAPRDSSEFDVSVDRPRIRVKALSAASLASGV